MKHCCRYYFRSPRRVTWAYQHVALLAVWCLLIYFYLRAESSAHEDYLALVQARERHGNPDTVTATQQYLTDNGSRFITTIVKLIVIAIGFYKDF